MPRYFWFEYPVHIADDSEVLKDLAAEGERKKKPDIAKARSTLEANVRQRKLSKREQLENAILLANGGDPVTVKELADYLDARPDTVRKCLRENGYVIDKNTGAVTEVEVIGGASD